MNRQKVISIIPNTMIDMSSYMVDNFQPLKALFYSKPIKIKPTLFYFPNDLDQLPSRVLTIDKGIEPNVGEYVALRMAYNNFNDVIKFVKTDIQPNTTIWYLIKDRENPINPDKILAVSDADFQAYINSIQTTGNGIIENIDCGAYVYGEKYLPDVREAIQIPFNFRPPRETIANEKGNEIRFAQRIHLMRVKPRLSEEKGDTFTIPPSKLSIYDNQFSDSSMRPFRIQSPLPSSDDVSISESDEESEGEDKKPTSNKSFKYTVLNRDKTPSTEPKTRFSSSLMGIKNNTAIGGFRFETPNENRTTNPAQRQQNIMNQTFDEYNHDGSKKKPTKPKSKGGSLKKKLLE